MVSNGAGSFGCRQSPLTSGRWTPYRHPVASYLPSALIHPELAEAWDELFAAIPRRLDVRPTHPGGRSGIAIDHVANHDCGTQTAEYRHRRVQDRPHHQACEDREGRCCQPQRHALPSGPVLFRKWLGHFTLPPRRVVRPYSSPRTTSCARTSTRPKVTTRTAHKPADKPRRVTWHERCPAFGTRTSTSRDLSRSPRG